MKNGFAAPYVLGLDVGSHSVGWAVLPLHGELPSAIENAGVRIFDPAVAKGDIEVGTDEPPGAQRRLSRQQRRLIDRRARRKRKLFHILQKHGLLPPGEAGEVLPALDRAILHRRWPEGSGGADSGRIHHTLPYWLRARALDCKLEPYELGRALYHLGQRRGFLSNRKTAVSKQKEEGVVSQGIGSLQAEMEQVGARTLGEFFAGLDPRLRRIRDRYTSRAMYEDEFERIWTAQAPYHPGVLTDELREQLHDAIFYQRPLRSQKGLIGECELEPGHKRAPWALLVAQRFRLLQRVNDTRIICPDGTERALRPEERSALIEKLETVEELKFARAKKLLKLSEEHAFNWETGGEKRFVGNTTGARLAKIFGKRWQGFSSADKDRIVEDLRSFEKRDALKRRAMKAWGLPEDAAEKFADLHLEPGYCRHCRKALVRLVAEMENGTPYVTACDKLYPQRRKPSVPLDLLPPLQKTNIEVRNPAVCRALTQLRKVVNGIIRRRGKPTEIRIELARDLRRSRKQRREISKRYRQNERARQEAAAKIAAEAGIPNPSRADIEKVLLAEECNWTCPYTGRSISMNDLFGSTPRFDVEHIIPFRRCLDNSFFNKTLCEAQENRSRKRNRTPWEAYGHDEQRWHEIIQRVKRFRGRGRLEKLRRFQTREVEDLGDIATRELNDTRYASRLAIQYLGLLYGGVIDETHKRRVQAARGGVTALLRDLWGANAILGDGGTKSRDDHRHHAVDAVIVALTDPAAIKALSDASARPWRAGPISFSGASLPWPDFLDDLRRSIQAINVSHAVSRRVRGPLHEETFYGPTDDPSVFHVRKRLSELSSTELDDIVDDRVRHLVKAKLQELGQSDPGKAFQSPQNHPALPNRRGAPVPIHKVRIRKTLSAFPVGTSQPRWVVSKANHHMEIVETTDRRGRPRWEGHLVSLYEAARRLKNNQPVVRRDHGPSKRFLFSLAPGETIELDNPDGSRGLYVVRSIWGDRIAYVHANDARKIKDLKSAKAIHSPCTDSLRKMNCRKVTVTPLGEVRRAND